MHYLFFVLFFMLFTQISVAQVQVGGDIVGQTAGNNLGMSISLSADGSRVATGAPFSNGNGTSSGQVRIFEYVIGSSSSTWAQVGGNIVGEASGDISGWSVSLSSDGTRIAVGAPFNDGNGNDAGHVRVYEEIAGNWVQIGGDIQGESSGDNFGASVSFSSDGTRIAVGAVGNDGNGSNSGHVRIYEYTGGFWAQLGTDIDGEAADDSSGAFVSLSSDGTRVAVGAPFNDGNGSNSGHVRIYEYSSGNWLQLGADIDGEAADVYSGVSVSLSADSSIVAIGTIGNVRIYEYNNGSWIQIGSDISSYLSLSGASVSLSADGTRVAVGSPSYYGNGSNSGHVRVYEYSGGSWAPLGTDIDGEIAGDQFGYCVSLSSDGTRVAGGAPYNDDNGPIYINKGQVRVFDLCIENSTHKVTACNFYTWIDGNTYWSSTSGPTFTLTNIHGCDSVVTLDLTIIDTPWDFLVSIPIGQGPNVYGTIGETDALSVNPRLNAVAFIHRSNYLSNGDAGSGSLRYDLSLDGGTTWNNNIGPIVNSGNARYPSARLTLPNNAPPVSANAKLIYTAPIADGSNGVWGGELWGSVTPGGSFNSFTQINTSSNSIKYSYRGALWTAGNTVHKAQLQWNYNQGTYTDTVIYSRYTPGGAILESKLWLPAVYAYQATLSIAFAPDGLTGYIFLSGDRGDTTTAPLGHTRPLYLATSNGGATWATYYFSFPASWSNYTTGFEADLTVDSLGNFHYLTTLGTGSSGYTISNPPNQVLVDFHGNTNGWSSTVVAQPMTFRGNFPLGQGSSTWEDNRPQLSVNSNGTRIVAAFYDTDTIPGFGSNQPNTSPNLYLRGYDVSSGTWYPLRKVQPLNTTGNDQFFGVIGDRFINCLSYAFVSSVYTTKLDSSWADSVQYNYLSAPYRFSNCSVTSTDIVQTCTPFTWIDGVTYTASTNTPEVRLTSKYGCDSIVSLDLTINNAQDIDGEAAYDISGTSVSLSADGSRVAIGAKGNDGNGVNSGHVRIYEDNNGSWIQIGSDIEGEAAGDWSGNSVSLSADGSRVAIGAYLNAGNGANSGHVRIYEYNNGSWIQIGSDIDGEGAGDISGYSVSLSADGSIVAIGAPFNSGNGNGSGHVRIYEYSGGNWVQLGSDIDGEAAYDESGWSVALSEDGTIVAIGAPFSSGNGIDAGQVRIYEYSGGNWTQLGSDIDGEAASDRSGYSVSLSATGSRVAIGAYGNDGNGNGSGHVRIYEYSGGSWVQLGADIDGEAAYDESGWSVALSKDGTIAAIGARYNDGNGVNSGHVRIYEFSSGSWVQFGLDIDGEAAVDFSGTSVSLSADGSIVAIGAIDNDGNGTNSGHVRIRKLMHTDQVVACGSYTWIDGNTYSASTSSPQVTLTSTNGCDSVVNLNLTINNAVTGTDQVVACGSYTWIDGNNYSASTSSPQVTLTAANGCDSVVTLDLTINNAVTGTDQVVACGSYTWIDGNTYSASTSSPQVTLTAANGCDSIVNLNLTINNAVAGTDQITACGSYTWIDGNTYSASTSSPQVTLTAANGCDSVVTLDLTINNAVTGTDQVVACGSYTWIDGNTYSASTSSPQITLTAANGCDSIVTLDLTINNAVMGTDQIVACGSYTWIDGNTYSASTSSPQVTLTAASGCDSVVTLDLTINNAVTGTDQIVACGSYTWIDGNTYSVSTSSPQVTLTAANGCDSIVTLDLTINNAVMGTDQIAACGSYTWIDGVTYTSSNNHATQVLTAANGCDSVVTLDLTINNSSTGQASVYGCNQIEVNGQVYTVSGTYVQTLTNSKGCDSILTINVSVTYSNFIQTQPNNTSVAEGQDAQFFILGPPSAQYQWQTNLGLGYQNLNNFGQYSGTTTQTLQISGATIGTNNNQAFRCLVTEGNCTDTSDVVLLTVLPNTSLTELENSIQLFPNPTTGSVTVVLSKPIGEIEVYNLQGKLLYKKEIKTKETHLDFTSFANGVYLIRVAQEGESYNHRVILQR